MPNDHTLECSDKGRPMILTFDKVGLTVSKKGSNGIPLHQVSLYHVLWAECNKGALDLHFMTKSSIFSLVHLCVKVQDDDAAQEWAEELMQAAYSDVKPQRRLKVLINPIAGRGKSVMLFTDKVEPILKAARCTFDVTHTEYAKHAQLIAKELTLDYDAIVTLSGDGLAHELFNGFAEHADPRKALSTPLVPIPTGSANGTCLSILGVKDGLDVAAATLNAIKGRPMKIDLCSVSMKDKRIFSYMSQTTGLLAELDVGTEHLRWMGAKRFLYGYIRGVIARKPCQMTISVKVVESDKQKLLEDHYAKRDSWRSAETVSTYEEDPTSHLPKLRFSEEDKDGWIDIDIPVFYLCAGKAPFSSSDLMSWPMALPNDGLIDMVVVRVSPITEMIKAMIGSEKGDFYWLKSHQYIKAEGYRIKAHGTGCLSIDGEEYPFEDHQVEVHRGIASFLSPYGHYVADFQGKGK